MREETTAAITLGALATLCVLVCFSANQLAHLDAKITTAISRPEHAMQTLTQEVTRKNGDKTTVTTIRGAEESIADFIARHDAVVAALKTSP